MRFKTLFPLSAALLAAQPCLAQAAEDSQVGAFDARYQTTYVWQQQEGFSARYSGANSLRNSQEDSYSLTATAFLGYRAWQGGELYLNPEIAQGTPLSGLTGLGGFTNGEIARASNPNPTLYRARAFLRQTWNLGGESSAVEADANQLAGHQSSNRLVITAGNFSVLDVFDNSSYAHDPRTQFLNWALMTYGAYDYAADARGYTRGLAAEYDHGDWALRAGRFLQPAQPNQLLLGSDIFLHYGDQLEIDHGFQVAGQPGKVHVLAYRNKALMSRYPDALDLAGATHTVPDINAVRVRSQIKQGVGLSVEQSLTDSLGIFARAMHADGQTETYAFTEIDDSLSAGAVAKGAGWHRDADTIGLALARNGLSATHRQYLELGGKGFFIGDGHLNYHPEYILEAYYNAQVRKQLWLSPDWQYFRNPAYNSDRGSLHVISVRIHTEFQ